MTTTPPPPPALSDAELLTLCRQCVSQLRASPGRADIHIGEDTLADRIAAILRRNRDSGRALRVLANDHAQTAHGPDPWREYVDRVIRYYLLEHRRIERLVERDDDEWSRLRAFLTQRASNMLRSRYLAGANAALDAADFAQQACESIYSTRFTYDVPFEAWATVILLNHIRKRYGRSPDVADRYPGAESLDRSDGDDPDGGSSLHELLPDPVSDALFELAEWQMVVIDAIAHLGSLAQQQVIVYTYLYDLDDDSIALQLGKSRQAIYNLRHRARQALRQILREVLPQGSAERPH